MGISFLARNLHKLYLYIYIFIALPSLKRGGRRKNYEMPSL